MGVRPQARFVKDVTAPDGCVFAPGEEPWPYPCRIVCVGGDPMGSPPDGFIVPPVPKGEMCDVRVKLIAPTQPKRYVGYWRLITPSTESNPGGVRFGQRFWIDISVASTNSSMEQTLPSSSSDSRVDNDLVKWSQELQQLADMGFLDCDQNIQLLEREEGQVSKVIEFLLANALP